MIKSKYSLILPALLAFTACNPMDDVYDALDAAKQPLHEDVTYTFTAQDYSSVGYVFKNKHTAADSAIAADIKSNLRFPDKEIAKEGVAGYLSSLFPALNAQSTAAVTYAIDERDSSYLKAMMLLQKAPNYTLTPADYASIWGEAGTNYLTPGKNADKYLEKILATAVTNAQKGDLYRVTYNYSPTEPGNGHTPAPVLTSLDENFDETVTDKAAFAAEGWTNFAEKGNVRWQGNLYNGDGYVSFSSYNSNEENIGWLITPGIDLTAATKPLFAFDITLGHYNASCLQVLISADYEEGDPNLATWTDITPNFYFDIPAKGFGKKMPAGILDLSAYKTTVHIAFKYTGDGNNNKTTTYQIDNLQIGENIGVTETILLAEDFETTTHKATIQLTDWTNSSATEGANLWKGYNFDNNKSAQITSYGSAVEFFSWLITPALSVPDEPAPLFTFDIDAAYYDTDCLEILLSEDFDGSHPETASWTNLTSHFTIPQSSKYSTFKKAGTVNLKTYAGKTVCIAFKYHGDAADNRNTAYEIDNVKIHYYKRSTTPVSSNIRPAATDQVIRFALYEYNGSKWAPKANTVIVNPEDYETMGITGNSFKDASVAMQYLPLFLQQKYPYTVSEKTMHVLFELNGKTAVQEYRRTEGNWTNYNGVVPVTEQYIHNGTKWSFDPTVVFTMISSDYQALVDFVTNDPKYKIYLDEAYPSNTEWWYGANAKYNNISMLIKSRKYYDTKAGDHFLNGKEDAECREIFHQRLQEGIANHVLPARYPDAEAIKDNMQMFYLVKYATYSPTGTWQARFKGIAKGKFEYVEGSQTELK